MTRNGLVIRIAGQTGMSPAAARIALNILRRQVEQLVLGVDKGDVASATLLATSARTLKTVLYEMGACPSDVHNYVCRLYAKKVEPASS